MTHTAKKLIEVALPLEAINKASAREKSIRHGHPSTLHLWWARRPLAAARAVLFAQMVDDPSAWPDLFPTEKAQEKERKRLFAIIEQLVLWENTTDEEVLAQARDRIWESWRRACAANAGHPQARALFDRHHLPAFHDPFAGGGSLPLEAQRLGLEAYASDLNPVAVLINKAMIEIPPKFAGMPPVNPAARPTPAIPSPAHPADPRSDTPSPRHPVTVSAATPAQPALLTREWKGAQGLAEDVRYYGRWMRDEAERRIGHLYPKVRVTAEMAAARPDLNGLVGRELTVIAWLWARTVKSPNPAFAHVDVPLASTFMLSTKAGKEAYIEPVIEDDGYRFTVKVGAPKDASAAKNGTKLTGANFVCLMSGTPITGDYIRVEGREGRLGMRLMAMVAEGDNGRLYLPPTAEMEAVAHQAQPTWKPDVDFFQHALGFRIGNYGMTKWSDVFTKRQLVALTTISDLVLEARDLLIRDANAFCNLNEVKTLGNAVGLADYANSVAVYLAFAADRFADYWTTLGRWQNVNQQLSNMFSRQAIPMVWDFPEANPFSMKGGSIDNLFDWTIQSLGSMGNSSTGFSVQANAGTQNLSSGKVVSTDPPYYDNIGYADLADFFYVWLRRTLKHVFPDLFTTVTTPKTEELVATPERYGGKDNAERFFLTGMTEAMRRLAEQTHPAFPVTVYYAFKQTETDGADGAASTGWETFLAAIVKVGFAVTGTWPIRTELGNRMRGMESNALATSVVIVCRQRPADAPIAARRDFVNALEAELPAALVHLQHSNIAPVDLAQAAIGPGMAVFTRYARVLDAAGRPLTVREALALINTVLDQTLAEQEGDFDADTRWALAWFEQLGFSEGEYGVAETLSKAKNTSVGGMVAAGFLHSARGKVKLLRPAELPLHWDPAADTRLTAWEAVHHLVRALEEGGELAAAALVGGLGGEAATAARELAYRLYHLCERKARPAEALSYNALVQSWPELARLAETMTPRQERFAGFAGQTG